jgi:hypothetical protein
MLRRESTAPTCYIALAIQVHTINTEDEPQYADIIAFIAARRFTDRAIRGPIRILKSRHFVTRVSRSNTYTVLIYLTRPHVDSEA